MNAEELTVGNEKRAGLSGGIEIVETSTWES
jgi:hypothetical protein